MTKMEAIRADELGARVLARKRAAPNLIRSDGHALLAAMQDFSPGNEWSCLTDGAMSLVDVVEHVLRKIGPSEVCISTWTMGFYDAERCDQFVRNGAIRRIRFLIDPSMFGRRPELSGRLVAGFGPDAFRAVNTHAKFAVLESESAAVAIRSSMNLNPNRRIESLDVACDADMAKLYRALVDDAFSIVGAGNRSQSDSLFDRLFSAGKAAQSGAVAMPRKPSLRAAVRRFGA